ncbi:MAG TPA: hypothetical protein VN836_04430 [Verrucomicrobiae bacterium]|nr:hypothetical protein [Verrucomicrobiae bacterium]
MKMLREILLERHRAAAPKLDAIRREVMTELSNKDAKAQSRAGNFVASCLGGSHKLWLELIWPCRRTWAILATVWIVLFIFNVSQRDKSELAARKLPPPSPEAIIAWRQQEKLLAELIGPSAPGAAERRKIFLPKPRTEIAEFLTV